MKRAILAFLCMLVALAIIPTTRDGIHWRFASYADTTTNYERYVKFNGDGKHVAEAKEKIESLNWQAAASTNTVLSYERYVGLHSDGKHAGEAKEKIESFNWQAATSTNTVRSYERYIELHGGGKRIAEAKERIETLRWEEASKTNSIKSYRAYSSAYPQGRFVREAETKAAALRTDQAPYESARQAGTETSFERFLSEYPGHASEAAARGALIEIRQGRDIVDLLQEKKIEIVASGSGIQKVSLRIRRLVPYPLTVRIPVGSFFVSANPSAQNMVATAEGKVRLTTTDWQSVSVDAACANRPKDIPRTSDTFTVRRSPNQAELVKLMPVLDKARADTYTRQAAVWIVTDNASFNDLGVLVVSYGTAPIAGLGSRAIREKEAVAALKILDEAAIDIKRKAIWRDRQKIIAGLQAGPLKAWLEEKK